MKYTGRFSIMKRLRWQLLIIFLTGLVVGVLLLGEQPKTKPSPLSTPEPVKGGAYTEALVGSLQRLNPLLDFANPVDRDIDRLIFSGLVRFDSYGLPKPDLAESWGISQDGTLYNFTLRGNARFHDNKPVTADDVIFTVNLIRTGDGIIPKDQQDFWKDVEVKKLSDTTLQFRLPEAFSPFLDYLTFGILPRHLLGEKNLAAILNDPFNLQPVGSGPFRFQRLIVENNKIIGVSLGSFDGFYRSKPFIQEFDFRFYPDGLAALRAYQQDNVQGIGRITNDVLPTALAEPNLAVYTGRRPEMTLIMFNLKNPDVDFLQNVTIRNALMIGLNRQWIIDRLLKGQGFLADGPIFPGTWAYYPPTEKIVYDAEAARKILKDAGYVLATEADTVRQKDKRAMIIKLTYPNTELHTVIAQQIQKDWSQLNVQVDLEAMPYDQLVREKLEGRLFQAALVDLNLTKLPDPDPYPFWDQAQATGGQNYSQWDHRMASEYLEQARVALEMPERTRLYRNFQVIFRQELPALPLYYPVYNYGVSKDVQGVTMGALFDSGDRFLNVEEWYLVARPVRVLESPTAIPKTTGTP